jgi:hypothetical protein
MLLDLAWIIVAIIVLVIIVMAFRSHPMAPIATSLALSLLPI